MRFIFYIMAALCSSLSVASCSCAIVKALAIADRETVGIPSLASLGFLALAVVCIILAARAGARADAKKNLESAGSQLERRIFEGRGDSEDGE